MKTGGQATGRPVDGRASREHAGGRAGKQGAGQWTSAEAGAGWWTSGQAGGRLVDERARNGWCPINATDNCRRQRRLPDINYSSLASFSRDGVHPVVDDEVRVALAMMNHWKGFRPKVGEFKASLIFK